MTAFPEGTQYITLPTSQKGYHAGKPIESVVYCLSIHSVCAVIFPSFMHFNHLI